METRRYQESLPIDPMDREELGKRALAVLEGNRRGRFTVPSPRLYPHQWSWDSAFIALGLAPRDPERALDELASIMEAQWVDGMVPHIRFNPEVGDEYQPGPGFWGPGRAPSGIATSGILQPPVHALALERLVEVSGPRDRRLGDLFDRIVAWHRHLMTARDPELSGGITILHPWESGLDNSPRWDEALFGFELSGAPSFQRVDQDRVKDAAHRPRTQDYDRYADLVARLRSVDYDATRLPADYPFRIKDVLLTAIFVVANRALSRLAPRLGREASLGEIDGWSRRVAGGFDALFRWTPAGGWPAFYADRDLVRDRVVTRFTCAGLAASFAGFGAVSPPGGAVDHGGAAPGRSGVGTWLDHWGRTAFRVEHSPWSRLAPSTAPVDPGYEPCRYWRGPYWINVQWLLERARLQAGDADGARAIREEVYDLVARNGFWEYFEPVTGEGLGGHDFSWTAALVLDFMTRDDSGGCPA